MAQIDKVDPDDDDCFTLGEMKKEGIVSSDSPTHWVWAERTRGTADPDTAQ